MANTFIKIQTVTVGSGGSSTIDFTSIPQTYTDLKLVMCLRSTRATYADDDFFININGLTTNQSTKYIQGNGASLGSFSNTRFGALIPADGAATASVFGNAEMYVPDYTSANYKSSFIDAVHETNATTAYQRVHVNLWSATSAITQLTVVCAAGNFVQYSTATLYGITNNSLAYASGGDRIYTNGTYWYHEFLATGTTAFVPNRNLTVDYLVVAGGGGGGGPENAFGGGNWNGGGGGAGGYRTSVGTSGGGGSAESALSLTANTSYTVTVGGGGAGGAAASGSGVNGTNGGNSVFGSITSIGGGGGARGAGNANPVNGLSGGSGGGGGSGYTGSNSTGGTATTNQGYAGGAGVAGGGNSGNGGGAGAVGAPSGSGRVKASGISSSITGTSVTRGTGGAGHSFNAGNIVGPANTGDGGDIGVSMNSTGLAGGSGIIVVRYLV
jgi:hypothetical protein